MIKLKAFLLFLLFTSVALFSQDADFTVHEWGTFTTLSTPSGHLLNGLTRVEEPVPDFVYSLSRKRKATEKSTINQNTKVVNVNARMETPVIYFYSDEELSIDLSVKFQGGAITEWYPQSTSGESFFDLDRKGISKKNLYLYEVDLTAGYEGEIKWKGTVKPKNTEQELTHPDKEVSPQWLAPRKTSSNLIENHKGQVEKYLFYRGIAHLQPPITIAFNTDHNLVISNHSSGKIPYVFVYENLGNTSRVLWQGNVPEKFAEVVDFQNQECFNCLEEKKQDFANALQDAGLFQKEAIGLLSTWQESYFHTEGIKVFWVMPEDYVNKILPMSIQPQPDQMERVFVGRSEIISPEKMAELRSMKKTGTLKAIYEKDRFYDCYKNAVNKESGKLSDILNDGYIDGYKGNRLNIYPNPAGSQITIFAPDVDCKSGIVKIADLNGRVVLEKPVRGDVNELSVNISNLSSGLYQIAIFTENGQLAGKFIKK